MARPSKSELENKIKHLKLINKCIEDGVKPYGNDESKKYYQAYLKWQGLTAQEQIDLLNKWDIYYKQVLDSPIYHLYQAMKKVINNNNLEELDDLRKELQNIKQNNLIIVLDKPSSIDPWDFGQGWIGSYTKNIERIQELKRELKWDSIDEDMRVFNE